jgi:Fe2+ or Zn2+ uptake regulation protein
VRTSKNREIILQTVQENRIHGTAEQIYDIVKEKIPGIGIATVYRNLHSLADQGLILKLSVKDGDRFDGCIEEHSHLICTACGKMFDIDYCPTFSVAEEAKKEIGFDCTAVQLIGSGICKACIN